MLKTVTSGERSATVTLDGTECEVRFSSGYNVVSVRAEGDTLIALDSGKAAGDDGTVMCKAGGTVMYPHMRNASSVFLTGTGKTEIIVSNEAVNPFKSAPVSGGGGGETIKYISDGLIGYSDLNDSFVFNYVFDETLGRDVNYCDGNYGYLTISNPVTSQLTGNITIQVLCKTSDSTSWGEIIVIGRYANNQAISVSKNEAGYFAISYSGGAITTNTKINDNVWHMLTTTYSDGVICAYVDGVCVGTYNNNISISANSQIVIGQWFSGVSKYIGYAANACIYNRALSADEVAYNYSVNNI